MSASRAREQEPAFIHTRTHPRRFAVPKKKDEGPKMKKLHWETLASTEGTIWGDLSGGNTAAEDDATALFPDIKDNFEISQIKVKAMDPAANANKAKVVSLIDGKKSQNMNIMLAQFGKKEFAEIAEAISNLDEKFIGVAGISSILDFAPEMDELKVSQSGMDWDGCTTLRTH